MSTSSQLRIATAGAKEGDYNQLHMQQQQKKKERHRIKDTWHSELFGRNQGFEICYICNPRPRIESPFVKNTTLVPV